MKSKLFFILFLSLFFLSLISATPPFQQGTFTNGYEIKIPPFDTFKQNTSLTLNFHVFNSSNGVPIDNTSTNCYLHFYNSFGEQILETEVPHSDSNVDNEWEIVLTAGNISTAGNYGYNIQCYSTTDDLGGFTTTEVIITSTGYEQTTAQSISSMIYLFLMLFLTGMFLFIGFKLTDSDVFWVLGVFFIFLSLIFLVYDSWLGYEYQFKYVGAANSAAMPEILFYIFLGLVGIGLLVAVVLLFKRLPELIKWFQVNFKKSEDGWDEDKF